MQPVIKEKVYRTVKGQKTPIGVMLAWRDPLTSKIAIGISLCSKQDVYNKPKAEIIANGRADLSIVRGVCVPMSLKHQYVDFLYRCKKYFQESKAGDFPATFIYDPSTESYHPANINWSN